MKIYNSFSDLVGVTPLVRLLKVEEKYSLKARLYAKLEYFNPAGSIKDRAALSMLEEAERCGLINKDTHIIEPTSGNTGIALAALCAAKGYKLTIVMSEAMSLERRDIIKAYGASLVLSEKDKGMQGAIDKANELKAQNKNSFIIGQFDNKANPLSHYLTTAREIYSSLDGKLSCFVSAFGTGGTISGCGKYFKEHNSDIRIVGIEPESSPFVTKSIKASHKIQGIGAGFIPSVLDTALIDETMLVSDDDAYNLARMLPRVEGYLVGISSGAALKGAIEISKRSEYENKNVVVILPDGGERYLSTDLYK